MRHMVAEPTFLHPCAQSVSVSGCAGATGSLWDALHAAAIEAARPAAGDQAADSTGCAPMALSQSQSDMDLDSPFASPTAKGAALASTVVRWSHGAGAAVQHPPQHALTTLSAVRCTSMRTCRVGLARSTDPALEGALLPDLPRCDQFAWARTIYCCHRGTFRRSYRCVTTHLKVFGLRLPT